VNQNILQLLSFLGGGASEGYGTQGKLQKVGGQPLLPKPELSQPDALSPYAPGNLQGGPQAYLGGPQVQDSSGPHIQPNATKGAVESGMRESANHPAIQLAQYLATAKGRSASAPLKRTGTDPGAFIRGGYVQQ
jgi:hypothetical protein